MAISSPRKDKEQFTTPPLYYERGDDPDDPGAEHRRLLAEAVMEVMNGKINSTGSFTLTADVTSTTLTDARIGRNTLVVLVPSTANAAAAFATTYQTIPNAAKEAAVFTHASNSQADKTYFYILLG
jgi:hypothetical protein